ncbi:MAG: nucleotide exchange factor GrpE, partial [Verrucomicrobiaceae bacterium]
MELRFRSGRRFVRTAGPHFWEITSCCRSMTGDSAGQRAFDCQATVDDPPGEWQEAAPMIPEDDKDPAAGVEEEFSAAASADTDPYSELEADVLKWKELAVRTAADLDNFRKRSAREREEAIRYANQGLLEDLLPVIDNFEMGMMAASQDKS